ncbi:hypothetical protein GALMADRAFT_68348 [Galerina marginata CBS 339.88]|uniref:Arrestin-like N-terminal domain-containing protein n=1 Tax=Galerina marginata (strain CBS 339.88) TaxID=685588 RepID=A0A067SXR9_GALM3|nr:hypothetical protein GALMADRAFT_68348 [Galerina marginata CBS 339.88]
MPHDVAGLSVTSLPPTYSTQPYENEETVAFTPRVGNSTPHGTFTRTWPQATLILKDQDEGVRLPTYGRHGRVIGELGLKNTDKIVRVTVKLHGQMSLSVADSGSTGATLISETQVLWKHHPTDSPHEGAAEQRCPSILPIYIQFPHSYEAEGKHWRLPPSFEATFLGIPALFVRCMYTLSVTITRTRSYHLASWSTNKTYVTMVNFRPRTRPNRPIVLLDSVFASIKPVPEEWLQIVANMNARPSSDLKPIECHLFIPSIQAFSLTDAIPFHLQLCSSLKSLRELLPPTSMHLLLPGSPGYQKPTDPRILPYAIRLSIARQVVVEVNGRRRFRTFTIGVGKMKPVPPVVHNASAGTWKEYDNASGEAGGDVCLDWQGEVKTWPEVSSGGFSTSNLIVKDFLVLALTPPNPRSSCLIPLQLSHPIRLVTDSWIDFDVLHPGDT